MVTKEQFVAILKTLEETDEKEEKLNEVMNSMSPDFYSYFYPTYLYKSIIIDLLNQEFYGKMEVNAEYGSDIEYFIYDLNYGKNWTENSLTELDGTPIDISTVEKLYDYLTAERNKEKNGNRDE